MTKPLCSLIRHPIFPLLVLLMNLFPLALPYLQDGYQYAHDRQVPFMRVFALREAIAEGQLPPRWFPDFDGGYGSPYPSFYGMLFYYAATALSFLNINIGLVVEITAFLTLAISATGMYLFVSRLWGIPSGFLAAVLYSYAPYHLVDAFVRGAYSELAAFVWFPLILVTLQNWVSSTEKMWLTLGAFSIAGLILTHNVMTLIFIPVALFFPLVELRALEITTSKIKIRLIGLIWCWTLALFISAYFWLPLLLEQQFVRLDYFMQFDYRDAFVAPADLLSLSFDYSLTKQAGVIHLAVAAFVLILLFRYNQKFRYKATWIGSAVAALMFLFMTTDGSAWVWSIFPFLSFVQFPWRFLAPAVFFLSIAAGALPQFLVDVKLKWALILFLDIAVILLHQSLIQIPDRVEFQSLDRQTVCAEVWGTQDYRPRWSQSLFWTGPKPPRKRGDPYVLMACEGHVVPENGAVINLLNIRHSGTNWHVDYQASESTNVTLPQFYYPGWHAWLDGGIVPLRPAGNHGLLQVPVQQGTHTLRVSYSETGIERFGNLLTLLGLALSAGTALTGLFPRSRNDFGEGFTGQAIS